jgi:Protein of unknown function (DUF1003)
MRILAAAEPTYPILLLRRYRVSTVPCAMDSRGELKGGALADSSHRFVHHGAFGNDRFGVAAERFARFFGTPRFIIGQTVLVVLWIGANAVAFRFQWDPYPFILLNMAFSTQAAYAAPLILLAATRQAERDKIRDRVLQSTTTRRFSASRISKRARHGYPRASELWASSTSRCSPRTPS